MSYLLPFFAGLAGSGSGCFLGDPLLLGALGKSSGISRFSSKRRLEDNIWDKRVMSNDRSAEVFISAIARSFLACFSVIGFYPLFYLSAKRGRLMAYLFGFFAGLVCSGSGCLRGRPGPAESFIASNVPIGYRASLVMGFIPALCMRLSTVLCGIPSFSAISVKVSPSIRFIIGNYIRLLKLFEYSDNMLYRCIAKLQKKVKNVGFFKHFILTYCLNNATIKI